MVTQSTEQRFASMSAPVLRMMAEEIHIISQFSDFTLGREYRLGVGTRGEQIRTAGFELFKGDQTLTKRLMIFSQGLAAPWFRISEILLQGYVLSPSELPTKGEELTLRFTLSRSEANRLRRLFVVVASRKISEDWYIVDGTEINRSHW